MAKKKHNPGQQTFDSLEGVPAMPDDYYSGDQPNPNLRRFVEEHATAYDPETDAYTVKGFNVPQTVENRRDPINDLHIYWSKKPYKAILPYVRHFTRLGEIVLDPFSGTGGTALAALIEGRKAIAIDRSPAATFIAKNYCTPIDTVSLQHAFDRLMGAVRSDLEWLYATRCDRCGGKATLNYTVYSQVFQCPRCLQKVPLFDCIEGEGKTGAGKTKKIALCPYCHQKGHKEEVSTRSDRFGEIPVQVSYTCENGCSPTRSDRRHNDSDSKKRAFFEKYDLGKIREIESANIPYWFPQHKMMNVEDDTQPWGAKWRAGTSSFRRVCELFTKRNLWGLATLHHAIKNLGECPDWLLFAFSGSLFNACKMYQQREAGGGPQKGTYYIPQVFREVRVSTLFEQKIINLIRAGQLGLLTEVPRVCISTQTCERLDQIPSHSIDYIFADPPYSENVQYGELNFLWESWLGFDTHWHHEEIIVNNVRGKTEADWAAMMHRAMAECYRILKPGRWLSLCYHDTSEGTWELIQDLMAEVGFVVDKTDSTLFIDTGQKSYNQLTADKATKRDLVLNFRKPKPGEWRFRTYEPGNFQDAARSVIHDFLTAHPGSTKDRIYDAVITSLVQKGKMEAHDFDALLKGVAEEVQQPVKEDLFRDKEPDLWGSHVQSRWYLKETADQVDQAEQVKEDAAAARLAKFIDEYLKKNPEQEGVHYSDLFEQYLPVHDKPRRLLADWLPEYFIKTQSGTWRLPDKEEGEQLAKLREAGTLRRIKRFANALIDGVPVREKDRPGSDVNLLDWLRQCRRAGLYEQGRAIYEKGGLNLANLDDEQQIEAEDNYRSCVKHGSEEEAKPKRKSRKKQDDDE
jgi:DNA modification methylase